jgi:hypothetical protein
VAGEEFSELVDWKRRSLVWLDGFVALVAAICGALTASNWLVVDGKVVRGYDLSAGVGVAAVASVGVVLALVTAFSKRRTVSRWLAVGELVAAAVAIGLTILGLAKPPSGADVWRDRGGGYTALAVAIGWLVLATVQCVLSFRRRVERVITPSPRDLSTVAERIGAATATSSSSAGSTPQGVGAAPISPVAASAPVTDALEKDQQLQSTIASLAASPAGPVLAVQPARRPRPAVDALVVVFWIAAVLSIIGGIVLGVSTSREVNRTNALFGPATTTTHNGSIVFAWVVAGILSAALWAALGVGLRLLAEIADNASGPPDRNARLPAGP